MLCNMGSQQLKLIVLLLLVAETVIPALGSTSVCVHGNHSQTGCDIKFDQVDSAFEFLQQNNTDNAVMRLSQGTHYIDNFM